MIFEWESDKERLLKYMKLPAKKKLEWLYQMNKFTNKFASKKYRKIWYKLREAH
jgi:hypothetical protein